MRALSRVAMIACRIVGYIIGWILILGLTIFGLKGCVIRTWLSPSVPTTYLLESTDGRTITMIFLPDNQTIIAYKDRTTGYAESVLTDMKGAYGTHCLGRLWHIKGPGIWFGYDVYPPGARPVRMEIATLAKDTSGTGHAVFREVGQTTHSTILFYDNEVEFERMRLVKQPTDTDYLNVLVSQLRRGSDHK